jgi:hypothetical protein
VRRTWFGVRQAEFAALGREEVAVEAEVVAVEVDRLAAVARGVTRCGRLGTMRAGG